MFDHRNFALNGLYPGLVSTFSVATIGQFQIEVEFIPDISGGGGAGYAGTPSNKHTKYLLRIKVSRKGKAWNFESKISNTTAKVLAKFIQQELPSVVVTDIHLQNKEQPEIEAKHVSTTKIR